MTSNETYPNAPKNGASEPSAPEPAASDRPESATTAEDTSSDRYFLARSGIWRALVHLCVPMIAAVSVSAIYNIVNAGFIGSLHSTPLLSAITFGLPVIVLTMAIGGVFGVGGGTMVSRVMGESEGRASNNSGLLKRAVAFTFWGAVIAGAAIGGIALLLLHPIVTVLGADAAAFAPTAQYVAGLLAFTPVLVGAFALEQIVRAEGATRASMIGLIAGTAANLVLDVMFILVLHWGVFGAALAIGLSNLVSVVYYVWFLQTRSANGISLAPRWFTLQRAIAREVFGVGVSELLMSAFMIVTSLLLNNLAVHYGDGVLAAFGVSLRIVQLPEFLCMGITLGALPLFAYAFGAGNRMRLRSAIRSSVLAIGGFSVVFSGLVFLFRDQVFGLFSSSENVVRDGALILTAQLVATIFNGITALLIAVFQGTGRMRAATIMSVAQGVLFIPVVLVGKIWFGFTGIVWAMTVTELLTLAVALVLYLVERPTRAVSSDVVRAEASVA